MKISLDQLLASRDQRWHRQQELLSEHPDETLLCLTVIMPGSVKRNRLSLVVAHAATEALLTTFFDHLTWMEERDLETGFEAYAFTKLPLLEAKRWPAASRKSIRWDDSSTSMSSTQRALPYRANPSVPSRVAA